MSGILYLFSRDSEEIVAFHNLFSSDYSIFVCSDLHQLEGISDGTFFVGKSLAFGKDREEFLKAGKPFLFGGFGARTSQPCIIGENVPKCREGRLGIVGTSQIMETIRRKVELAAATNLPVLILGESGSGKSFIAERIHEISPRCGMPFFGVNMASVIDSACESELFGVEAGTFTEVREREGIFSAAAGGTLFLDEIGDVSLRMQGTLLDVIERGEFRRVGSTESAKSDARLIFATNADLKSKIAAKEFRLDLFYRIANIVIEVPPLRERREDIPLLAEAYLRSAGRGVSLSHSACDVLRKSDWPGNIRQMQNTLNRAILNCGGTGEILPQHIEIY